MSARDEMLAAIRGAIGDRSEEPPAVPRAYQTATDAGLDEFIARLHHYQSQTQAIDEDELVSAIQTTLRAQGVTRVVAPDGLPAAWLDGFEALHDNPPLTAAELDAAEGVLTTCAAAIADTGTIVLDGGPGMGRRILSLVPDYHLCVVYERQLASSVPAAMAVLEPTRPLTFISGPSATVDIELVRVRGVHGPRRLDVIIVRSRS